MSYHTVEISGEGKGEVTCSDGKLIFCRGDKVLKVPLEDVAAILVTARVCSISSYLMAEASERRIPVVICKSFRPVSVLLPVQRSVDTLITRTQIEASQKLRTGLWAKTVAAKVENQLELARAIGDCDSEVLEQLEVYARSSSVSVEGTCAKLYWKLVSRRLGLVAFVREYDADTGLNSLLNYAYAVLLSETMQGLLCAGLDPMYGIGHVVKERAVPLAYDIMEIFRPYVDAYVMSFALSKHGLEVSRDFKVGLMKFVKEGGLELPPLDALISVTVSGLKLAFLKNDIRKYKPWQWRTTKWDGFSSASTFR